MRNGRCQCTAMQNAFALFRSAALQRLFPRLVLTLACSAVLQAHADEVFSRSGLDPSQQSKVTGVLARERIQRVSSQDGTTGQTGNGAARAPTAGRKECRTDIGNVNAGSLRPGQRAPKENIIVIKAPVINNCR